jgi:formate dehydrogenase major subunit
MVRRGYPVTVYESYSKPGGMLYHGIPFYRLPEEVLMGEIQRIIDLGVELRLDTSVGKDITLEELRTSHKAIFLGIGAHEGRRLGVPGEDGPGVMTGTAYLNRINTGEEVDLGSRVVVIGGGDTAVDAARTARRRGAEVTILYRRTRAEMPAIDSEVDDSQKEGVAIHFLAAPIEIRRDGTKVESVVVQRMQLGEPDSSGRRRPVPIEGSEFEVEVDTLIAAISQQPSWANLEELKPIDGWLVSSDHGRIGDGVWAGGDVLTLGLATTAIGHGRIAADAVHAKLRGLPAPAGCADPAIDPKHIKVKHYAESPRSERTSRPVDEWLTKPDVEIDQGLVEEQFLSEAERCFSCGLCLGCEQCAMYCNQGGFTRLAEVEPGAYYTIALDRCEHCGKCVEVCPSGFLSAS